MLFVTDVLNLCLVFHRQICPLFSCCCLFNDFSLFVSGLCMKYSQVWIYKRLHSIFFLLLFALSYLTVLLLYSQIKSFQLSHWIPMIFFSYNCKSFICVAQLTVQLAAGALRQ
ncbi:hypothetical protein XELAEV_18005055mg [Xenopus laevis]|uniref:Uncharacterized protein n=1 Tax=Xenopus laevis TaxID=8355 RepID=A0A974DWK4_XENLA|nr:hypothetical protein XELAEV_18005055mg [Xenopus laevis]